MAILSNHSFEKSGVKTGHNLRDVTEFIESLDDHSSLFEPQTEITIARAPGRLDVMGGIADYSGSLVLELPIAEATIVALQKDQARQISIISLVDNETCALISKCHW